MTIKPKGNDPLDINARLYRQIGRLLDDMEAADRDEKMTMPQRISALIAVGRIQKMFQDLRKGDLSYGAGSAVAKYAEAFASQADGTRPRGRKPGTVVQFGGGSGDADRPEPGDPDFDYDA